MKNKPYKRKVGDFEIRVLRDGRLVMIAPDEELHEIANSIEADYNNFKEMEIQENARAETENQQKEES